MAIIIIGTLVLGLKLTLAFRTVGTNDVLTWETSLWVAQTRGPIFVFEDEIRYRDHDGHTMGTEVFNHPPLMIQVLRLWGWLAGITGIPLRTWLRVTSSLADAVSLLLIGLAVRRRCWRVSGPALCALAACPLSVFVAGFHGNTDPVMILFLVASAFALECYGRVALCGLLLGLAVEIKIVPILLIPALLLYLPRWRDRAVWLGWFALASLAPVIPYARAVPLMVKNILAYTSVPGHWGVTWWLHRLRFPDGSTVAAKYLMFAALLTASLWLNRKRPRISLFHQWGFLLFLILFLMPGFGIQYLEWLVPWVVVLGNGATITYYLAGGAFAFAVYTFWSRGFPWYFANAWAGDWHGPIQILQQAAWLSVLAVLYMYWRSFCAEHPTFSKASVAEADPAAGSVVSAN